MDGHDVAPGLDDGRLRRLVAAEEADAARQVQRAGAVEGRHVVEVAPRVRLQLQVVEPANVNYFEASFTKKLLNRGCPICDANTHGLREWDSDKKGRVSKNVKILLDVIYIWAQGVCMLLH